MKIGDLIIGKPESDFQHTITNSKSLLKVVQITEGLDKDLLVEVVAFEHGIDSRYIEKKYVFSVSSKYFRLATKIDKADFLMNLI